MTKELCKKEKGKGEAVFSVIRKMKYPIESLAKKLNISRNTLYNKFKDENLSYEFMNKVGEVIGYDFSLDFPEMYAIHIDSKVVCYSQLISLEGRYAFLLQKHNDLFLYLIKNVKCGPPEDFERVLRKYFNSV